MSRVRKYIETDVLTEAKKRLLHIIATHDHLAVMFSGGKDSLVVLHLLHEVFREHGITAPVKAVFRDEELIQDEIVEFVDKYRRLEWIDMLWFAVPLASHKYVLGVTHSYVQWDPNRDWVRPKPEWSIHLPYGDDRVFEQSSMDAFTASFFPAGKVAFLTGIRASESIMRYRASVNKLNENYINAVTDRRAANVSLCKPIFDWEEMDVLKYLHDRDIPLCPLYDHQAYNGINLRVSTPLHAEAAKKFDRLRSTSPDFYARVTAVFPEMLAHERYFGDLDREAIKDRYGASFEGVASWIEEHITDENELRLARAQLASVQAMARTDPALWPPRYVLMQFMSGAFKRALLPFGEGGTGHAPASAKAKPTATGAAP